LEIDWSFRLLNLFVLVFLSAFFSGSEVALFSLKKKNIKDLPAGIIKRYLIYLIDHPRRLLVTVLLGNTVVNVAASVVAVSIALSLAKQLALSRDAALTAQIIILTIIVVLFGELIPKVFATKRPLVFGKIVAFPMYWTSAILFPISEVFTEIIRASISKLNFSDKKVVILPEEIPDLTKIGQERGTIFKQEHGIIQGIVEFSSVTAQEIMTARVDILSLNTGMKFEEVISVIQSSGFSRFPLVKANIDEIIGIIYAKDLLRFVKGTKQKNEFSLATLYRKVLFVPKTKKINELFYEFQREKMHIAIVVDEYGGTAGLVTMEDIIEEIIGEIRDEYDKEENPVTKIDDNHFYVLGKLPIVELNELLGTNIDTEEPGFETVAGLILNEAGNIPKEGYSFISDNHKFTVKEILKRRIKKVLIEKLPTE